MSTPTPKSVGLAVFAAALLSVPLAGCGSRPPQATAPEGATPHLGEAWFSFRAETLGIDVEAAKARDAALPGLDEPPPKGALDEHTAREAAVIYVTQCARCHGIDGQPVVLAGQATPKTTWGSGSARFAFSVSGDDFRTRLFGKVHDGVLPGMPAWGQILAREQIWALIRHVEGF